MMSVSELLGVNVSVETENPMTPWCEDDRHVTATAATREMNIFVGAVLQSNVSLPLSLA